jgi:leucyl aminopeptidase (aminopeptidase T)
MSTEKITKFEHSIKIDKKLKKAAEVAIKEVLAVKSGEKVLIVTNPDKDVQSISKALYDATVKVNATPIVMFQPMKTQLDFAEPAVIHAIGSNPDVLISMSHEKLGKDHQGLKKPYKLGKKKIDHVFHYLLAAKKLRAFWSPSTTAKMFAKTVPINYKRMRNNCLDLVKILNKAEKVRITTELGMDLEIGLKGRKAKADDGNFTKPGTGGNLPCGEVYISPELGASNGKIIFDGSISAHEGVIIIKNPITVNVKNGVATKVTGKQEAVKLRDTLKKAKQTTRKFVKDGKISKRDEGDYLKNVMNLGELGIGLNEKAEIVGNMLEDEKVNGTCHIAIGANYDDDAKALIHLDGLIKKPTLTAIYKGGKEHVFMKDGKLI